MKKINATTKRGNEFINAYGKSKYANIYECYANPSQAKRREEMILRRTMIETGGQDFRILSYNTFQFTCGWITASGDLRVETRDSSYIITNLPFWY